jgi:uncharacterized membrane protein YqjE
MGVRREPRRIERALMDRDANDFAEDLPEPGWKERLAAVKRAAKALAATRTEIFREELAGKGSLLGMGMAGLVLAFAFASLALLLATALIAALFARLFGGPIAGIAAALVLYLLIAAGAGFLGVRSLGRVRPLDFPATRDELRKDLDAIREEAALRDRGPASPDALAAERASIRPGERDEDEDEEARATDAGLEERFRAGSE